MKEPYREGLATHPDPESCASHGNVAGEALTRAHAGQPLSSEITSSGVPTLYCDGEGHTVGNASRELAADAAESETLSMRGNSVHGNRETPEPSPPNGDGERSEKVHGRTSDVYGSGESDGPIVPKKRGNHPEGPRVGKGESGHRTVGGRDAGNTESRQFLNKTPADSATGQGSAAAGSA